MEKIINGQLFFCFYIILTLMFVSVSAQAQNERAAKLDRVPVSVEFSPSLFTISEPDSLSSKIPIREGQINPIALNPKILSELNKDEFYNLIQSLAKIPVLIKWHDQKGRLGYPEHLRPKATPRHWGLSNGAAALALLTGISQENQLIAKMIAVAPEAILPIFEGHVFELVDKKNINNILLNIILNLDKNKSINTSKNIANLTEKSLSFVMGSNPDKLVLYFNQFVSDILHAAIDNGSLSEQQTGILTGSVLAGVLKYSNSIRDKDTKKLIVINGISNVIWAATTFIGLASIAGTAVAAAAGAISVGVVSATGVYNRIKLPRDYSGGIKEIEGILEMVVLENIQGRDLKYRQAQLEMLAWIRASIHINGLSD